MFYTSTQVGKIFNVTGAGVLYWEKIEVLKPSFKRGNRRMYSEFDIIDYANTLSKRKVLYIDDLRLVYEEKEDSSTTSNE